MFAFYFIICVRCAWSNKLAKQYNTKKWALSKSRSQKDKEKIMFIGFMKIS